MEAEAPPAAAARAPESPPAERPEAPAARPDARRDPTAVEDATWEKTVYGDQDDEHARAPQWADARYVLPDLSGSATRRNWIPWTIIGSGVLVSLVLVVLFGRPPRGIPEEAREALKNAPTPENTFVPPSMLTSEPERLAVPVTNVIVDVLVQPSGASVSVGNQTVVSPSRVTLELPKVTWPLALVAEAPGYVSYEAALPRHAFSPSPEGLVYRMTDSLAKADAPAPSEAGAGAAAQPALAEPAKEKGAHSKRASTRAQHRAPPAEQAAAAQAEAAPAAPPDNALEQALACLGRGDNACVLSALASARGPRELDLLIETHRAMGNSAAAEKTMARYLELHPDGRRASQYRRALGLEPPSGVPRAPAPGPSGLMATPPPAQPGPYLD